ncbi:hypothetical protein [Myroides marinus]|uniref:hypothetical protein n=1 Tax=Myroides marinus TaxID=703342 RepID=UPI002576004F|nr:hypothetical protein [Myroides marinus]MDM1380432.1 hypothetical protein [Myroides marinus]MDM1387704.1 hypothetical protein [Myroides marinus]MDM1394916.1 hypothetical protein [Myroides marinus]
MRIIYFLFIFFCTIKLQAQKIEVDKGGNLSCVYFASSASLKKGFANSLIYKDGNWNEIEFTKDYLNLEYKGIRDDENLRIKFFSELIERFKPIARYQATYEVKGFDRVHIKGKDNNVDFEYKTNIHGYKVYKDLNTGFEATIKKNIFDNYEYRANGDTAILKKKFNDSREYTDNKKNNIVISSKRWNQWIAKYHTDEGVLFYLVSIYLNE